MPRYYFHIRSPGGFIPDLEGSELQGIDTVRREAAESARDILREALRCDRPFNNQNFEVTDEGGRLVLTFPFRDAIRLP